MFFVLENVFFNGKEELWKDNNILDNKSISLFRLEYSYVLIGLIDIDDSMFKILKVVDELEELIWVFR